MSTVPPATGKQAAKPAGQAPPDKDLRGLMPYLRRYPSGIVIGLLTVVLMGIVGNVLPLATGVMTDTLAGNPVPFEHSAQTASPLVVAMNRSNLRSLFTTFRRNARRHSPL